MALTGCTRGGSSRRSRERGNFKVGKTKKTARFSLVGGGERVEFLKWQSSKNEKKIGCTHVSPHNLGKQQVHCVAEGDRAMVLTAYKSWGSGKKKRGEVEGGGVGKKVARLYKGLIWKL